MALITSLSTLAAVALTGLLARWTAGSEAAIRREDRAEAHRVQLRQIRRETYRQMLAAYGEVQRVAWEIWDEPPPIPVPTSLTDALFAPHGPLVDAHRLVQLEGPPAVAEASVALMVCAEVEMAAVNEALRTCAGTRDLRLLCPQDEFLSRHERGLQAEAAFVLAARTALGGNDM